jgi:hypothetical protein
MTDNQQISRAAALGVHRQRGTTGCRVMGDHSITCAAAEPISEIQRLEACFPEYAGDLDLVETAGEILNDVRVLRR